MHVYRFRILSEEHDDFLRDVEILANQTFEDLHQFLVRLFEFDGNELASFSICNGKWFKMSEITLIDMRFEEQSDDFDDDNPNKKAKIKTFLMSESKLKSYIEDPHQRIIYEYDFLNLRTFYLELSKILTAEEGTSYPRCVKSEGSLPKKSQAVVAAAVTGDLTDLGMFDDNLIDDEDFVDEIDEGFASNIGDGFEIESGDQGMEINSEDRFEGGFEESGRN
jgi:hypothetical protein